MYKAGIIGGAGYIGGELIRLMIYHPKVMLEYVQSTSHQGQPVYSAHPDLQGESALCFTSDISTSVEIIFLAQGHGASKSFISKYRFPENVHIIDMSQDFRVSGSQHGFSYGLPEANLAQLQTARHIANPGCFATAILLGLLPLAQQKLLNTDIHTSAITGSTGAGQQLSETTHFSWRYSNISVYKAFTHQHEHEIRHLLENIQNSELKGFYFLPYRGNFTRGILASSYLHCPLSLKEVRSLYNDYYHDHPFIHLTEQNPDLKRVVNTNKCFLYLEKHQDTLLIISAIDNLLKGAAGQAIQNMNILLGLDQTKGLNLKASAF